MKRFLFIYQDSHVHRIWYSDSFIDLIHIEEVVFPKHTTDWEVVEKALEYENNKKCPDPEYSTDCEYGRKLLRILQVNREVPVIRELCPEEPPSKEV